MNFMQLSMHSKYQRKLPKQLENKLFFSRKENKPNDQWVTNPTGFFIHIPGRYPLSRPKLGLTHRQGVSEGKEAPWVPVQGF